jgi:hypothetical protein
LLERLVNVSQVIRADNIELTPIGLKRSGFMSLNGKIEIKAYRYLGTKEDSMGSTLDRKSEDSVNNSAPSAASVPANNATNHAASNKVNIGIKNADSNKK